MQGNILVGCGAGFSGDRLDAALPVVNTLIRRAQPSALIFENLAERTLAFAQIARAQNAALGYEPLLEYELRPILELCLMHGIVIIGNFGAANPHGAAACIARLAQDLGLERPRIGVVTGDDIAIDSGVLPLDELFSDVESRKRFISANAYQGAFPIAQAILAGAQIVVTGRVADPALTLGPAIAHFGWNDNEWDKLASASVAGHLLECGSQVTGGYFSDPGKKDVPGMANLGFPIAEIAENGSCIISKADDTGGLVDRRSVTEQLLYEIHDPECFITPDVVADISNAEITVLELNVVRLSGVRGRVRPATLKTNVYYDDGWLGEAEISYAGINAEARARLSMDVIRQRMNGSLQMRFDLIGAISIKGDDGGHMLNTQPAGHGQDIRLRVAAAHEDGNLIDSMLREVNALYNNGPAGGGGVRLNKRRRVSMKTCFVARDQLPARFSIFNP